MEMFRAWDAVPSSSDASSFFAGADFGWLADHDPMIFTQGYHILIETSRVDTISYDNS